MLMSSLQFAAQILMAKFVLHLGIVERKHPEKLSWHQYFMQGNSLQALSVAASMTRCRESAPQQRRSCF